MGTIAVFGGTGYAGGHIAREAAGRGHEVTSFTRHLPEHPQEHITYRQGSIFDPSVIVEAARADTIVVALPALKPHHHPLVEALPELVEVCVATRTRLGRRRIPGNASSQVTSTPAEPIRAARASRSPTTMSGCALPGGTKSASIPTLLGEVFA